MRKDIIEKLATQWRIADNYHLATGRDALKRQVLDMRSKAKLTKEESKELEKICNMANNEKFIHINF